MNIVFLGGSITWGDSATSYENSWAARVEAFLRERLAGLPLHFHNVAIPGTGSEFGAFRLGEHVLCLHPDILFIEFAVNDFGLAQTDPDRVVASLEYIVRTLILHSPQVRIVLVYSALEGWRACAAVHEIVAGHYSIPSIDVQAHFRSLVEHGQTRWRDLVADHAHPTDLGHTRYADLVIQHLEREWYAFLGGKHPLPAPLHPCYCFPRIGGISLATELSGWRRVTIRDKYKRAAAIALTEGLFAAEPGSVLRVPFWGRYFGLYHRVSRNSGIALVEIDGGPAHRWDCYYNTGEDYVAFHCLRDLPPGRHEARITVSSQTNTHSTGYGICIGGFLLD